MSERVPAPEKKKVTPRNLTVAFIVLTAIQLLGLGIIYVDNDALQQIVISSGPSFAPVGTTPEASAANAVLLVLFAFAATLVLLFVLRRRMLKSFKFLIFGSVSLSAFLLTTITADSFAVLYLPASVETPFYLTVSTLVVIAIAYTVFVKNNPWLSTAVLAFAGAQVGGFFAATLNLYTALILPIAFALYDIYAVFRGPLKHLIGSDKSIALNGMSVKLGEFTLGLGDVVFYTMLPALAYVHTTVPPIVGGAATFAVIAAIDTGVILTLALLSKRRLLPGLPIPMLFGVAVLGVYLL